MASLSACLEPTMKFLCFRSVFAFFGTIRFYGLLQGAKNEISLLQAEVPVLPNAKGKMSTQMAVALRWGALVLVER